MSLADVHGLFGGNNVYLTGDGQLWVQAVTPGGPAGGMTEARHHLSLKAEEMRTIAETIVEKKFLDSQDSTRKGMPDEARPVIRLEMGDGQTKEVSRWERDRDEGVDALRAIFRDLIRRAKATPATSGGIVDSKWRPPGWE